MFPAFLGWNIFLYLVGEEDDADLVVILDGTEGEGSGNLRHHVALGLHLGTEVERTADIYHEHHGELAFLLKNLDVRAVEAGSDVPVDVAYVIAELVLPHLTERHTASLESRVVLSGKDIRTQATRLYLYLAYFL